MKGTNHPKVMISQPLDSLPPHLREELTRKDYDRLQTQVSSTYSQPRGTLAQSAKPSLFNSGVDHSMRITKTETEPVYSSQVVASELEV